MPELCPALIQNLNTMYKLIAFNEVSANFTAYFGLGISPYFDHQKSNETGRMHFMRHKLVRHFVRNLGYEHTEPLESFVCRRFGPAAWKFLRHLTK